MKKISEDHMDIIMLEGRIDQEASEQLEAMLDESLKNDTYNICIDMINVKHICSSALGVLVSVKRKIKDHEGDIKLVIANDNLMKLFRQPCWTRFSRFMNPSGNAERRLIDVRFR
jgi:anti-anti-sigma factor